MLVNIPAILCFLIAGKSLQHCQIAGIPESYKYQVISRKRVMAQSNNLWYGKKFVNENSDRIWNGQSAAKFLSLLCKDMEKVQRL